MTEKPRSATQLRRWRRQQNNGDGDEDEDAGEDVVDTSDGHWQSVVADIRGGEYDEVLGQIEDDRESVRKAIEERREELGG